MSSSWNIHNLTPRTFLHLHCITKTKGEEKSWVRYYMVQNFLTKNLFTEVDNEINRLWQPYSLLLAFEVKGPYTYIQTFKTYTNNLRNSQLCKYHAIHFLESILSHLLLINVINLISNISNNQTL